MPFIAKWPGSIKPGSINTDLIQNLDYAETFLDIAGASIPENMQGKSLVPLMKGETPDDWREAIYYHYHEFPSVHMVAKHNGIRTDRYKLINFYQFGEWEFYDLEADPDEMNNLYNDPAQRERIHNMKQQLKQLEQQYQDNSEMAEMSEEWKVKVQSGERKP